MDKIDYKFERLLEEAIKESFEEEISQLQIKKYPLSKTFKKQMNNLFRPKNWQNILKKVAIFILLFTGASSLLITNNQTAQAAFQNFLAWATEYRDLIWYPDHLSIEISPKEEDNIRVDFKEAYIPEEYKVVEFEDLGKIKSVRLLNSKNEEILISISSTELTGSMGFDNEHTKYETEEINGKEYLIGQGIKQNFGNFILVQYKGYYYEVYGTEVEVEELILLAEKIFERMENSL